jgi:hypothetical protein
MSFALVSGFVMTSLAPLEIKLAISSGNALPVIPKTELSYLYSKH